MANIEQNICEAIEVIANNIVSKAGYDRTIQATILSCINEATGKYKVRYQDSNLYAFTGDLNKKYSRGTQVYILVPGSDMSKNKTIIGEVGGISAYEGSSTEQIRYVPTSENLIQVTLPVGVDEAPIVGINSKFNINTQEVLPELDRYKKTYCNNVFSGTQVSFIDKTLVTEYTKDSKYFLLSTKIHTNFDRDIVTRGDYGVQVHMKCKDTNNNAEVINTLILNTQNGITNPYYLKNYESTKYFIFQIPDNFIEFTEVEVFCKDFYDTEDLISEDSLVDPDIYFKDISLYTANSVQETLEGNGIILSYPQGRTITKNSKTNSLSVVATVVENYIAMADDQHSYYWFKKDLSVSGVDKSPETGYNEIGGVGWYCLNEYDEAGWKSASNEFTFSALNEKGTNASSATLLNYENEFKIVAVRTLGETTKKYEESFKLYNSDYNFLIDIISPNYNDFLLNNTIHDLELNCRIRKNDNEQEIPETSISETSYSDFFFYWGVNVNGLNLFGANIINIFNDIDFEESSYDLSRNRVLSRKLKNINLSHVTNLDQGVTFYCTVKQKKVINHVEYYLNLKTVYARISLTEFKQHYNIEIINKTQLFQYDAYNRSPFFNNEGTPQQLGLRLIDNWKNEEIDVTDEIEKGKLIIDWNFSEDLDATLFNSVDPTEGISVNGKTIYKSCTFTIKSIFDYDKVESSAISVIAKYEGGELHDRTQLIFTKVGQYGTNGTQYTAEIVTRTGDTPRWVTFTTRSYFSVDEDGNKTYGISNGFFNFDFQDEYQIYSPCELNKDSFREFPFTFRLRKNGEIITDAESKATAEWFMHTMKYGTPERECKSNFYIGNFVDERDNETKLGMKYIPVIYENNNYNVDEMREYMPANILVCKITYLLDSKETTDGQSNTTKMTIYAYLPIVHISNRFLAGSAFSKMPKIDFNIESGYDEVVYSKDGVITSNALGSDGGYKKSKSSFEIILDRRLSKKNKGSFSVVGINGRTNGARTYTWLKSNNLILDEDQQVVSTDQVVRSVKVDPTYSFMGDSTTNGLLFRYVRDYEDPSKGEAGHEDESYSIDSYIHIPICMHLNQYSLGATNDWNGTSIDVNEDGGYIIAPQVIAGEKDSSNRFTGVVMGSAKDSTQKDLHPGLYGYVEGEKSFGVYADSGFAFFGKKGRGQIAIEPEYGGYIYSSGFFSASAFDDEQGRVKPELFNYPNSKERRTGKKRPTSKKSYYGDSGMLIDLEQGGIYYGTGNFAVDELGNLTSIGGHFWNGLTGNNEAYLDLNPEQPPSESAGDQPSKGLYRDILKYKNKLRITKADGTILSAGGHFSNMNGSMFLDFQEDNENAFITTGNQVFLKERLELNKTHNREDNLYPEYLTGFLMYCLEDGITPDTSTFKNRDNIKFAVGKNGNIFAKGGKIGGFYLQSNSLRTTLNDSQNSGDISLFTDDSYSLPNFSRTRLKYYTNTDGLISKYRIIGYDYIKTNILYTKLAIGSKFAVDNEGDLYCQDIYGQDIESGTIKTAEFTGCNSYTNTLKVYGKSNFESDATFSNATFNKISVDYLSATHDISTGDLFTKRIVGKDVERINITSPINVSAISNDDASSPWVRISPALKVKKIIAEPPEIGETEGLILPDKVISDISDTYWGTYTLPWMIASSNTSTIPAAIPTNHLYIIYEN